ncbi:MAG: hypothetical protein H7Z17_16555 [Fuerstia sp.]|nr:hypothetical protein [Fuerstiella sp.]
MLNRPSFLAPERRIRIGRSGESRPVTAGRSRVFLTSGSTRVPMSIVQAVGFDLLVSGTADWYSGQRVKVGLISSIPMVELKIPGRVHWQEQKHSEAEFGIVLDDSLPEEFVVREPGCERSSLRFSTHIDGTLHWLEPHAVSSSAIVVNYSRQGVCLKSSAAPKIGTEMRFAWKKDGVETSITGVTRWMIGQDVGSLTGVELTNALGYAIAGVTVNPARTSLLSPQRCFRETQ